MGKNWENVGFCAKCGFFDRVHFPREEVYFSDGSGKCPDCGGPAPFGPALDRLASTEMSQKLAIEGAIESLETLRDELAIAIGDEEDGEEEDGDEEDGEEIIKG